MGRNLGNDNCYTNPNTATVGDRLLLLNRQRWDVTANHLSATENRELRRAEFRC